jgi:hypothetical protein
VQNNKNKFVISQFLGVCNSACPKELYNELQKYLMEINQYKEYNLK